MEMASLLTQLLRRPAPPSDAAARASNTASEKLSSRRADQSFTRELKQVRSSARQESLNSRAAAAKKSSLNNDPNREAEEAVDGADGISGSQSTATSSGETDTAQLQLTVLAALDTTTAEPEPTVTPCYGSDSSALSAAALPHDSDPDASPWKVMPAHKGPIQEVDNPNGSGADSEEKLMVQVDKLPVGGDVIDPNEDELKEKLKLHFANQTGRFGDPKRVPPYIVGGSALPSWKSDTTNSNSTGGGGNGSNAPPEQLSATAGRLQQVIKPIDAVVVPSEATGDALPTRDGTAGAVASGEGVVARRQAASRETASTDSRQQRAKQAQAVESAQQGATETTVRAQGVKAISAASIASSLRSGGPTDRIAISRLEGDSTAAALAKALLAGSSEPAAGTPGTSTTNVESSNVGQANGASAGLDRGVAIPTKAFASMMGQNSPAATRVAELLNSQQPGSTGIDAAVRLLNGASGSGRQEVTLQLDPPELGRMRLEVRMQEQTMSLRVDVQSRAVAKMIESRLPELREALGAHGITIDKSQVIIRPADAQGSSLGRESDTQGQQQPGGHSSGQDGSLSEGQSGRDSWNEQAWGGRHGDTSSGGWTDSGGSDAGDDTFAAGTEAGADVAGDDLTMGDQQWSDGSVWTRAINMVA